MIDPVTSRPAGTLEAQIQRVAADTGPGAVPEESQARFENALNAPKPAAPVAITIESTAQDMATWVLPAPPAPEGVRSMGDRILQGMNGFQESWSGTVKAMEGLTTRNDLQPSEMLNLQFQIGYSSFMMSTVSQQAGTVAQKIDGLLKMA